MNCTIATEPPGVSGGDAHVRRAVPMPVAPRRAPRRRR
jgi:hypothetical protein